MTDSDHAGSSSHGDFDRSLRHAISLHPRPFQVGSSSSLHSSHHGSPHRSPIYTEGVAPAPSPLHISTSRDHANDRGYELREFASIKGAHGKSSSYEVTTPDEELHDPVARHARVTVGSGPPSPGFEEQNELEGQRLPQYTRETDPFSLSSRLKSQHEIDEIKANTSRKRATNDGDSRAGSVTPPSTVSAPPTKMAFGCLPLSKPSIIEDKIKAHRLQSFYEEQNENIQRLLKPVDDHRREARDIIGDNQLKYKIAVQGSFIANVLLAVLQTYAAASSGSLALFTTMADALFDPLSNVMLILSNRAVNRVDSRRFPSGKARIETAGNIVFCFLMTSVSLIIIVQSIEELVEGNDGKQTKPFYLASIIAVAVAFCTKLALFTYCFALRHLFSQIRILWEDHRNDLLINGLGLLTSLGGSYLRWWIDPMGAIILSTLIVFLWLRTAYSEFQLLIGVSADTQMLQLITYICRSSSALCLRDR